MKITIAERFHPFSHRAGTQFLLPETTWMVQVFPARLCFSDLEGKGEPFFLHFGFKGPLEEFTAELDLERAHLKVFGQTKEGFMRYTLFAKEDGIYLHMEKVPGGTISCRRSFPPEKIELGKGETLLVCLTLKRKEMQSQERLSLGMHKSQDWDLLSRRLDLKEILPLWLRASALVPEVAPPALQKGNFHLLEICRKKIESREKEGLLEAFENLFLSSVDGVFVPSVSDFKHQGIIEEESHDQGSALPLLSEIGKCIRSLFFQELEGVVSLLPCLPPKMHCGRMTHVKTAQNAVFDFEWTKKTLRLVAIASQKEQEICLKFPKGIRTFRWKASHRVSRVITVGQDGQAILKLEGGKTAHLDRFES